VAVEVDHSRTRSARKRRKSLTPWARNGQLDPEVPLEPREELEACMLSIFSFSKMSSARSLPVHLKWVAARSSSRSVSSRVRIDGLNTA
jgi:hypothetical protein